MDSKCFPLGEPKDNRFVKVLRVLFGIACLAMGGYWLTFILRVEEPETMLWIAVFFLAFFGVYQVLAGLGKTFRYIKINMKDIILKKSSLGRPVTFKSIDIEKIDIYPLSIVFIFKATRKTLLRFGAVNNETNEKIVDELISFAETNVIKYEIKEEL
ncbi:MAG TPA: hypothetical protein VHO50_08585 [Bacteroidales bacterium]|nr:hypothetical protein [Bacteroidales bacterium]